MSFSRTVETYVDIDAPPQRVWDVLVDFPTWPDWNLFIPKVDGSLEVGQTLHITVAPPGRKPWRFSPVVWVVRPCEEILWGGGRLGIFFRGDHALLLDHFFRVEPASVRGSGSVDCRCCSWAACSKRLSRATTR